MDMYDRIEQGMTTVEDAEVYARLVARLARCEIALREIAIHGCGRDGMIAAAAMAGRYEHDAAHHD